MRLDIKALVGAVAAVAALAYVVCFLFVVAAPEATTAFFGYVTHTELGALARPVGLGSFVGGFAFWTLFTALCAALTAWTYNRWVRP